MSVLTPRAALETRRAAVPDEPIYRLSVAQYREMIQHGILDEDDPVELLEGHLVLKMPKRRAHSYCTQVTRDVLASALPTGWFVEVQEPITTAESEPESDVSVVRGERRQFRKRHPRPRDVGLLIEVSDTTLRRDRGPKKRIYARALIAVYWIINPPQQQVEVYSDPTGLAEKPDYRRHTDYAIDEEVPLMLDGREFGRIEVKDLFR